MLFAAIVIAGVLVAAFFIARNSGSAFPLMAIDSDSYLGWAPSRTPAYPLLLRLVRGFGGGLGALPYIQYALVILAVAFFTDALALCLGSSIIGFIAALGFFANPFLMTYPLEVMSDPLFLVLLLLHAACILRLLQDGDRRWALLGGLALGAAILARPVGYAFLFGLPWILFAARDAKVMKTALAAAAALLVILVASAGNYVGRGYFATQEFGGDNLLYQVAWFMPPSVADFDPAVTQSVYADLRPIRDTVEQAQGWDQSVIASLVANGFTKPVFRVVEAAVDADAQRWKTASPYWREIAVDALAWRMVGRIVLAEPVRYAKLVVQNLYAEWFLPQITTPVRIAEFEALFARNFARDDVATLGPMLKPVPGWAYIAKFALLGSLLMACLAIPLLALARGSPALYGLGYLAVMVHCYFGVIAGVGVGVPRYIMMVLPLEWAVAAGVLLLIWRHAVVGSARR
jgi:hypothetical protein